MNVSIHKILRATRRRDRPRVPVSSAVAVPRRASVAQAGLPATLRRMVPRRFAEFAQAAWSGSGAARAGGVHPPVHTRRKRLDQPARGVRSAGEWADSRRGWARQVSGAPE